MRPYYIDKNNLSVDNLSAINAYACKMFRENGKRKDEVALIDEELITIEVKTIFRAGIALMNIDLDELIAKFSNLSFLRDIERSEKTIYISDNPEGFYQTYDDYNIKW